jgi:hypothetical protein
MFATHMRTEQSVQTVESMKIFANTARRYRRGRGQLYVGWFRKNMSVKTKSTSSI